MLRVLHSLGAAFLVLTVALNPTVTFAQADAAKLPTEEDSKLNDLLSAAQQLNLEGQYTAALEKLEEAEKLKPKNEFVTNLRGGIYTAMREFDKARECFQQTIALDPKKFEPRFNLTELDYVQGDFAKAEKDFTALLTEFPKIREEYRHLMQFKILVCQLKQDKMAEAEAMQKNFTFLDDTPAHYYGMAAFAFYKKDLAQAQEWLTKAARIYSPQKITPYVDSLTEARWIPSITLTDDLKK